MELEGQPEASHRVVYSKNQDCSQSSAIGDEQGNRGKRPGDVCCIPSNIVEAARLLSPDEREDVKKSGFGAFLDLKLVKPCKPKEVQNLMSVSELKEDHIAMKVHPGVTLNFRPDVVEKLMKVPRGTSKLQNFNKKDELSEYTILRDQLGAPISAAITTPLLMAKLKSLENATEARDKALKLRIFYLILISSYLVPTAQNKADKFAVFYTRDITKIADHDWCTIIYEHLRELIRTRRNETSSSIRGCIIALLVYFLDNFHTEALDIDENKDETPNQDKDEIAIINLYDEALVKNMFRHIKFRDGMFLYTNLQLKDRGHTCYGESSTTQISSLESQGVSAGVQNEEILAATRLSHLEKLLLEVEQYVPPTVKEQIKAAVRPQVETNKEAKRQQVKYLYDKHVKSKISSYDQGKTVFNINHITMSEDYFVEAFKPEGHMHSDAVNAQLSIWNAQRHDSIYLSTYCAAELANGGSNKSLSRQLTAEKIKRVKLIFVPIFYLNEHCFLVVANLEVGSLEYIDSLDDGKYYAYARKVAGNLKEYLCKHDIDARTWSFSNLPVMQQKNNYDCGFRMMLHMILYQQREMYTIGEEMVLEYRMEFAVELIYSPSNIVRPTTSRTGGSVNKRHEEFSDDASISENSPKIVKGKRGSKQESKLDMLVTEESPRIVRQRGRTDGNGKGAGQQEHPKAVRRKTRVTSELGDDQPLQHFLDTSKKAKKPKTKDQSTKPEQQLERPRRGKKVDYKGVEKGLYAVHS